jgi:hypothetical protein
VKAIWLRICWWFAGPILRPIIAENEEYAANLRRSAKMTNATREWQIECIEKADAIQAINISIEKAFGCTYFNEQFHYIRRYK